jgi:hypothetical protein
MTLIDEWRAGKLDIIELHTDDHAGDGWLILVPHHAPEEHIATVFHAGGVTWATVWHGTGAEQSSLWRDRQRCKAIAAIAAHHADTDLHVTAEGPVANSAESDEVAA